MQNEWFVGVDISKATLDVAVCHFNKPDDCVVHRFGNNSLGYKSMFTILKRSGINQTNSFFCMEHTGHHTLGLCCCLQERGFPFTLVSPSHLKKSLGLVRGKNDRVDAQRIAKFACLHHRLLKPMRLPSTCLLKLKNLLAFRDRLVKTNVSLANAAKDLKSISSLMDNQFIINQSEQRQKFIEQQIADTDHQIQLVMKEDEQIYRHFTLITSVIGVGMITATAFLIYTQDFTAFENGRQFACYSGVAPFEFSSGSSIRGKTKVSPLANRKMKSLLSNCASAAVQHDPELKMYYQHKIKDGKAKMAAMNAVKTKLINRVFATVH
ncbi:IS110 family transposase [Dyadobacter sp. 676]|uniref:IS110 family transposase n=1 Tax=Dyadobacter sp. 676 TaxID=3088362 RepID=A0AAU8FPY0_9BACT